MLAAQTWLAWHVAVRVSGSRFVGGLAFVACLAFAYPYPSLALAFAALLVARRAVLESSLPRALLAGVVAGVAGWFRQDVGFVATLATAAVIWSGTEGTWRVRAARAAATGCAAAATLALLLLPAILAAPDRLWEGLVTNPAATVPFRSVEGGWLAVFRQEWVFGAVAILAAVGGVLGAGRILARPDPSRALVAGLGFLALWALRYLCLRPDTHHLIPAGILVGVLGATAVPRASGLRVPAFLVCAATLLVPFGRSAGARAAELLGRRAAPVATLGDTLPGATMLYVPANEVASYRRLVERVQALVPQGRPFFSACRRHDFIHDQDLLLHFVADRPATPFDWHFDPGVTTREDVQRRLAADVARDDIRVVVRTGPRTFPEFAGMPPGSGFLDAWLAERFRHAESAGKYEIWLRK